MTCEGCGATLPPPKGPGRARKWCSERCRKRSYDLECVVCGGRVDGTTPSKMADATTPVCLACTGDYYATWTREAIVCAIQEWADEHGGIPPAASDWLRARARGTVGTCSVDQVRRRFGTWNAAIIAAGFEPHATGPVGGYKRLTAQQRTAAIRRYAAGESSVSIAADLGCAPASVTKAARKAGVPIRGAFGREAVAA